MPREEEAGEEQQVCREEGAAEVPLVGERDWPYAKWCAESSQEHYKSISNGIVIIFVPLCINDGNYDVCEEENEGRDDGVELEEGGDQGET